MLSNSNNVYMNDIYNKYYLNYLNILYRLKF